MRTYAYVRVEPNVKFESSKYLSFFNEYGYKIQKNRLVFEEASVKKSISYRDILQNLIEYALEENDLLVIKSIDCLGCNFEEILFITNKIYKKNIRLICLDYSKSEIKGDMKVFFIHFLKLGFEFEKLFISTKEGHKTIVKKVGRPESLTEEQKKIVIDNLKSGESVYALAKQFSVTRTVIQRILDRSVKNSHSH